ncbi:uncharacterized protein [Blastocystis hominis]|uniref:Glycerol-3-phosphate dehydrogenase [NAD(+)] n=1 Tax=Blastocystis hominis TaxID=12968 RepID=D8M464_BLAHO|nr:uncharacterized protein [Blastocystis hominis]CBK22853.2 unnamed protein product [Blastocystis hominis]|eukprot:XP_012896901.1 uncharacterized protein [Blastocystis hominis]
MSEIVSDEVLREKSIASRKARDRVAIIGSGNWASALSIIIGNNAKKYDCFENEIKMWVYEEMIECKISCVHPNGDFLYSTYLHGFKLPENIIACPDLVRCVEDADCLVFCIPHQFLPGVLNQIKHHVRPNTYAISCIKGVDHDENGRLRLITGMIYDELNIDCSIICGANVANQIAAGEFAEATLGYRVRDHAEKLQVLFNTPNFCVQLVNDPVGVEFCGSLKNVIALGAGFVDALGYGSNTKAALIRIGLQEMKKFAKMFYKGVQDNTFFQSAGVADLITTCWGGRNVRCAEAFARTGKSWEQLEAEMLNGQKLQGTTTCKEVYDMLINTQMDQEFPLMVTIYNIAYRGYDPKLILEGCRLHNGVPMTPYSMLTQE